MPKVTKAVIPAAGLGTRFLPATKSQPKEMLPIVDTPVMQYVVEEAAMAGLEDILIITGRGKRSIEDHFDYHPELEERLERSAKNGLLSQLREIAAMANLFYIRQKETKGLGHAILHARPHVGDQPFCVLLGDTLFAGAETGCSERLLQAYQQLSKPVIAVERVDKEKTDRYGIIDGEEIEPGLFRLRGLVEKPLPAEAPSDLAVAGRYVLTPDVFDRIEGAERQRDGEIGLTPALNDMARDGEVYAQLYDGKRYDIGNRLDYVLTTIEFALARADIGEQVREHIKSLAEQWDRAGEKSQ